MFTSLNLHVSPVPNYQDCLKRLAETTKSSQAGVMRAESDLDCLRDQRWWAVGCYVFE